MIKTKTLNLFQNKYFIGIIYVVVFAIGVALLLSTIPGSKAAGTINGTVYLDYNQNGTQDTSGTAPNYSIDIGVSGVAVTAYDSAGTAQGSTTTDSASCVGCGDEAS